MYCLQQVQFQTSSRYLGVTDLSSTMLFIVYNWSSSRYLDMTDPFQTMVFIVYYRSNLTNLNKESCCLVLQVWRKIFRVHFYSCSRLLKRFKYKVFTCKRNVLFLVCSTIKYINKTLFPSTIKVCYCRAQNGFQIPEQGEILTNNTNLHMTHMHPHVTSILSWCHLHQTETQHQQNWCSFYHSNWKLHQRLAISITINKLCNTSVNKTGVLSTTAPLPNCDK